MSHVVSVTCRTIAPPAGALTMPGRAFERLRHGSAHLVEQCRLPLQQALDLNASAVLMAWLGQAPARRNMR